MTLVVSENIKGTKCKAKKKGEKRKCDNETKAAETWKDGLLYLPVQEK